MGKITDRQVEEHPRCFLFGHYDSRGGATLIPAKNLLLAFGIYASCFGYTKDANGELQEEGMRKYFADGSPPPVGSDAKTYEEWLPDAIHSLLEEDFMFSCRVIVCDEVIGESNELDEKYVEPGDTGYKYGLVQYRWQDHKKWSDLSNGCEKTLIFWKGKQPTLDPKATHQASYLPGLELRIVRQSYGEDSSGVSWLEAPI